jgi:T5SS/PEP-CTERM-associated repeat protein
VRSERERNVKRVSVSCVIAIVLSAGLWQQAQADLLIWDNGGSGSSWNTANNWNPNKTPTSSDDCRINDGGSATIDGFTAYCNWLTLGNAGSGTLTLSGTSGGLTAKDFIYIGDVGTGTLNISGSTKLYAQGGNIDFGHAVGSTGTGTVTGSDAELRHDYTWLRIGNQGTGSLSLVDGGYSYGRYISVGTASTGNGDLSITGTDSQAYVWGDAIIGHGGTGSATISGGGLLTSNNGVYVGYDATGNGYLHVGAGGTSRSEFVAIGTYGTGEVLVDGGGKLIADTPSGTDENLYLGEFAGATGQLTISGSGSKAQAAYIGVGQYGQGTVYVQAGGQLESRGDDIVLGTYDTGSGTIIAEGSSSKVSGNRIIVARGTLDVRTGALVDVQDCYIGAADGGTGTLLIDGGTVKCNNFMSAYPGTSNITISGGGKIDAWYAWLGLSAGQTDTSLVTGSGSKLDGGAYLAIAQDGHSTLTLQDGGTAEGDQVVIGVNSGANGEVIANGGTLNSWGNLTVGDGGTGSVTVLNGGTVYANGALTLGANGALDIQDGLVNVDTLDNDNGGTLTGAANGTLRVNGFSQPSTMSFAGTLQFGRSGTSSHNIGAGDTLDLGALTVGYSGTAAMNVPTGGTLNVSGAIDLGDSGTLNLSGGKISTTSLDKTQGTFNWSAGELAFTEDLTVQSGQPFGSSVDVSTGCALTVDGTVYVQDDGSLAVSGGAGQLGGLRVDDGSTVNLSSGSLTAGLTSLGDDGAGTFEQSGGTTMFTDAMYFGTFTGSSGLYELSGGSLTASAMFLGRAGDGTLEQTGGTGSITGNMYLGYLSGAEGVYNLNGGDMTIGNDLYIGGNSDAAGGAGTVNLSGGQLTVNGSVKVWDDGEMNLIGGILATSTLTLAGGTLGGRGTVYGDVIVVENGIVSPGNSPGLLTIDGDYTMDSLAILEIELGGLLRGDEYDALVVTGDVTLAGTLDVTLYGSYDPSDGDSFDILDWGTLTGTFDTINLPGLAPSLSWDTSTLYTSGVLSVSASVQPVPVPGTAFLTLLGLATAGGWMRRHR